MSKFKIGDKVVRIEESYHHVEEGQTYEVVGFGRGDGLLLKGLGDFSYDEEYFKLVEEKDMKQFTKDMLVAGKHVVELRNGHKAVFIGNGIFQYLNNINDWMDVDKYSYDLSRPSNDKYSVVKVYEVRISTSIGSFKEQLNLIWKREEKSQKQIDYENLMAKIAELQKQAENMKPV